VSIRETPKVPLVVVEVGSVLDVDDPEVGIVLEITVAAPGEDFKYPPQLLQKSSVAGLSVPQ
jgi:hypothetical protein